MKLQTEYRNAIRDHAVEMMNDHWSIIKISINENFKQISDNLDSVIDAEKAKIDQATKACDKSVKGANKSAASLLHAGILGTVIMVLSPVAVVADIIVRIIQMCM